MGKRVFAKPVSTRKRCRAVVFDEWEFVAFGWRLFVTIPRPGIPDLA